MLPAKMTEVALRVCHLMLAAKPRMEYLSHLLWHFHRYQQRIKVYRRPCGYTIPDAPNVSELGIYVCAQHCKVHNTLWRVGAFLW
jgi:hypothetical protein